MQEEINPRVIEVGLEGIIQFQGDDATLECIVRDITRDYTEVVVIAFDQRVCSEENVELRVILPTERSPIKCTGKIVWYSNDGSSYLVRILIISISRIERRRLELVIAQKKAVANSGRPATYDPRQSFRFSFGH